MLVRMLIGPLVGQVVDLPYAEATSALQFGTAENADRIVNQALPDVDVTLPLSSDQIASVDAQELQTEGEVLPPGAIS